MEIEDLCRKLNIVFREKGSRYELLCPLHADRTPSASFYKNTNRFYCFTCQVSLTRAQLYARVTGEDPQRAKAIVGENDNEEADERKRTKEAAARQRKLVRRMQAIREANPGIAREEFAREYELGSSIIWLGKDVHGEADRVDKWWEEWYNRGEGVPLHGAPEGLGTAADSLHDRVQEGLGTVLVMGRQKTPRGMGSAQADDSNRVDPESLGPGGR